MFEPEIWSLTAGVDIKDGTAGNDTFIADNTGLAATKQLSVADQINGGAGTDTLKVFLAAADTTTGQPTLTSIENVWINGGAVTAYTAATGTTGLTVEAPVQGAITAGSTYTLSGQAVTLKDAALAAVTGAAGLDAGQVFTTTLAQAAGDTATALGLTVNNLRTTTHVGADTTTYNDTQVIDVAGAKIATLNLTASGANSTFGLTNTGAALRTLNVAGDKNATISGTGANTLTTVNASAATGALSIDVSGAARAAAFKFTGGAGNDKLTLAAGDLALLTSGAQLDGGAGIDTLVIKDTTLAYAALNKVVGFEVLGLGVTAATVDASQLTSIKSFSTNVAASTINNLGAGSSVAITGATTTVALGAALGNTATDITIGSATAAGFTTASLTTTGLTTVGLTVNGTSLQTIGTFGNSDNTTLTIKGAADLTITNPLAGTTTGSKVDASALTGKLTVTGSGLSDVIIGGTNDDNLTGGANAVSDTFTGGAGKDLFNVLSGVTAATADVITDFVTKVDTIEFGGVAGSATNYSEGLAPVADFAAALAAANAVLTATGGAANAQYNVQQVGSDSWVFFNNGTAAGADQVVKLTGVALSAVEFIDIV